MEFAPLTRVDTVFDAGAAVTWHSDGALAINPFSSRVVLTRISFQSGLFFML